jgi:hypothetical protein
MFVLDDDHHAEFFSDGNVFFEKFFDLFRLRVGGDVEILRLASEQKIAHAAADPERGEARRCRRFNNFFAIALGESWRFHFRFTIYDLRADLPADSSIANRISQIRSFRAPNRLLTCAMPHLTASTGSDGLNSKTLMCSGFTNGLSAAKSIVPVPGAAWSPAGKSRREREIRPRRRERFQMQRVVDEAEVLLDLRVAAIVPIERFGLVNSRKKNLKSLSIGNFLERLAVFAAELEAALFGFGQDFSERVVNALDEFSLLASRAAGSFGAELFVFGRGPRRVRAFRTIFRCNPSSSMLPRCSTTSGALTRRRIQTS